MIYFAIARGTLKIGYTSQALHRRITSLRSATKTNFLPLGTIPGGPKLEGWLHQHFAPHRIHGELYRYAPLKGEIALILRTGRHPEMPAADDAAAWKRVKSLHGWGRGDMHDQEGWRRAA